MDLLKTYIQVPHYKKNVSVQITLDNDFNVIDSKPDMERIIQEKGSLNIREIKAMQDKCLVRGTLNFSVLYVSDDGSGQMQAMDGEIPFEEMIHMDGMEEQDLVSVQCDMEDLRAGWIHSRKINVRSIIILHVKALRVWEEEVAKAMENKNDIWVQNKDVVMNQCIQRGKDQMRVRDEVRIPSNRPNILDIIWHQEHLENIEMKLQDGYVRVQGQLSVFALYRDEMMENTMNDVEFVVNIDGRVDMPDVTQEMIPDIKVHMDHVNLDIRSDSDGESRKIGIEAVLALDIQIYQEERLSVLQDIYSSKSRLIPEKTQLDVEQLILKNKSRCAVRERIHLNRESGRMLQLCHARASVKIDQMEMVKEGIMVEGVVYLVVLYISSDDQKPVNSTKMAVPFSYSIEAEGISENHEYDVYPSLEQLVVTMADSDEIEAKMMISLDASVFSKTSVEVIRQIREESLDFGKLEAMPGIVGHMVKSEDTLWTLAKMYYVSPEDIKEVNGLDGEELPVGKPILIVKNMEIFK